MDPAKAKILLVEDDTFISGMYQTKLSMLGYSVRVASDGEAGWAELQKEAPNIVLLDIVLPKKDGFEILSEIRASATLKNLPVILLTNLGQKPDVQKGLELGADDYIIKAHFTPTEVVEKIEKMLAKKIA
ncbi:MAG: response regulator [bacterium]|nr:response regulator [bacterium]